MSSELESHEAREALRPKSPLTANAAEAIARKEARKDELNSNKQNRRRRGNSAKDDQLARDLAALQTEALTGLPVEQKTGPSAPAKPSPYVMPKKRTQSPNRAGIASGERRSPTSEERAWREPYIVEANLGWQHCRLCGRIAQHLTLDEKTGLRFGHIKAWARGGSDEWDNLTLVCRPCDHRMGHGDFTGEVRSLKDESEGMLPLPFLFERNDEI